MTLKMSQFNFHNALWIWNHNKIFAFFSQKMASYIQWAKINQVYSDWEIKEKTQAEILNKLFFLKMKRSQILKQGSLTLWLLLKTEKYTAGAIIQTVRLDAEILKILVISMNLLLQFTLLMRFSMKISFLQSKFKFIMILPSF